MNNLNKRLELQHYIGGSDAGYLIMERVGRGGMSAVYKARSQSTGNVVALKALLPRDEIFVELVGWDRLKEIFLEEAHIIRSISHEHIVKIVELDDSGQFPYIVLDYYPRSLGSVVLDSTRTEVTASMCLSKVYGYICQALHGLERLHRSGIVHRDIKPYNLMISADDVIKIIDFGLCTVDGEEKIAVPGMQVGSPYYTAPEQVRNPVKADERSDLFSLGVTIYRLLTGRLVNWKTMPKSPPSEFNGQLDADWDAFLLKSIARDVSSRFQSASEMREHLEALSSKR